MTDALRIQDTKPAGEVIASDHPIFGAYGVEHFGYRWLDNNRCILLKRMITNVRVCIADEDGVLNGWCYSFDRLPLVLVVLDKWDGEGDPFPGWHRNPFDGRRRTNGDPEHEYVAP